MTPLMGKGRGIPLCTKTLRSIVNFGITGEKIGCADEEKEKSMEELLSAEEFFNEIDGDSRGGISRHRERNPETDDALFERIKVQMIKRIQKVA